MFNTKSRAARAVCGTLLTLLLAGSAMACTTILVGKNLTADGSVMMIHAEDMDYDDMGRIYLAPHKEHAPGETVYLPWETVPQPAETNRYWAVGNWSKTKYNGDVLGGLNEKGVGIACNVLWSKGPHMEGKQGLRRYSIRQIVFDRASSAREGVEIIAQLIAKYGQADTKMMDTVFCLADQNEAWAVEATDHNWVAKRVPDDGYLVWANEICIEDDWDLASPEIMETTKRSGGQKVNYKKEFGLYGDKDVGIGLLWNTARKARAEELLASHGGKITVQTLLNIARDHYEGTDKALNPPHSGSYYDYPAKDPRPICTIECQEVTIFQMKGGLPAELGAKMWVGPSSPCVTSLFPIYAGTMAIPPAYTIGELPYSLDSAWWRFETIQRLADKDYANSIKVVRAGWLPYESRVFAEAEAVEAKAAKAYADGKAKEGRRILTAFSVDAMEEANSRAMAIVEKLLAMNIKAPVLK